ncbi:MAG: Crp/Fnr family transcriptional regulator [Capnocytophaga sp.]|nr:Crp/Fnr family transcriptional regulator [Capnocytophaga sp.]
MDILSAYFSSFVTLTENEIQLLTHLFEERTFKKRTLLLQERNIAHYFYFVCKGCLKMYKIDDKGGEHILQFATENHWVTDIGSFHQHTPSFLTIEAVEDTVVYQITLDKLNRLYEEIPKFNLVFRKLSERNQQVLQARILEMLSGSAQDCYLSFAQRYPQLLHRLPQTQIAAFLGVTPEFFSKMKAQLLRERK